MTHNDSRWRYNLAVSSGQELATAMADYIDYAVDLPTTRVIGLFMETARKPERFMAALDKARDRGIPVVALKLARTAASAHFAATHSGALAGNHAAYEAVFERHGVLACTTVNEFAATLLLLGAARKAGDGALAAVLDSGGYRELLADLAQDRGVPFARFTDDTMRRLRERLPSDLEPANPLDAWSSADGFEDQFADYFRMVTDDPGTSICVGVYDLRTSSRLHMGYTVALKRAMASTDKPMAICTNFSAADNKAFREELADDGIVVFDGTTECLDAVRHAFAFRDSQKRPREDLPDAPPSAAIERWAERLACGTGLGESDSLDMLADCGVAAVVHRPASDLAGALAAAREVGYPVALKTAAAGVNHKSDVGGVKLNLADEAAVRAGYLDLAERLGPDVILSPMAPSGVELTLGMINDPQFGPLVMVGAGGVLVELMKDRSFALAPCSVGEALRMIDRLKMRPMLDGLRGAPPVDVTGLAQAIATFSAMAWALRDQVQEIDVNPVIVHPDGCIAVDALVVRRPQ
jgi:acyl-CoA synthetase (NDP forming)